MSKLVVGLALCLGLTESLQLREEPHYYWSGKNGDLLRTGASSFGVSFGALAAGPAWSWHEKDNGLIRAAPLIDGQKNIYLSSIMGGVHKFTPEGVELWQYYDTSEIPEVPCLYEGALFVTNTEGIVTKLDMESGKTIWRKKALVHNAVGSAGDTWSMTAADGTVITAVSSNMQNNDYLVAMDAESGDVKWSFRPDGIVYNSLQDVKEGSVVFSDFSGKVYRLNLESGDMIWKAGPSDVGELVNIDFSTGGTVTGPNGILYTTSNARDSGEKRGYVTAFNFSDGKMIWRHSTGYEANNGAVVGMIGGRLAVAIGVGSNPDMPPDALTSWLYHLKDNDKRAAEKKARVVALDAATGEEIWQRELPAWHGWAAGDTAEPNHICLPDSFGNPALSGDGTVYVGFESGTFYGINDRNNDGKIDDSEVDTYDTHNAFQGSPAIAPGMVVATPCNGLHVFKS